MSTAHRFSDTRWAMDMFVRLLRSSWWYAAGALAANSLSALFEGSTIGLLSMALYALGPTPAPRLGSWFEFLNHGMDALRSRLGPEGLFLSLVGSAVAAQVFRSGFQFLGEVFVAELQGRVHTRAHGEVFRRMMGLPFLRISAIPLGNLTDYLNQTAQLTQLIYRLNVLTRNALCVAAYGVLLLWLSWPLTLAVIVVFAVFSGLLQTILRVVGRVATRHTTAAVALSERVTELLQAIRLIHTFSRHEETIQRVDWLTRERTEGHRKTTIWSGLIEPLTDSLTVVGVGFFLIGGYLGLAPRGLMTMPALLAFLLALYRVVPRLRTVYCSLGGIVALWPGVRRVVEILNEAEDPRVRTQGQGDVSVQRTIEFRDVTLQYHPDEPPAVAELSLVIPRGRFLALVGGSGAGKSTIVDLFLGLFAPTAGTILIDGVDLRTINLTAWRSRLGVVDQQPFLFHATIRENIMYGKPEATMDEIVASARAAHSEEFISRLTDGYETVIGERGYRLSGGQRQRIALARALVRQPDVLILDEATSALDSQSEHFIQAALDEQRGRRTVLAIAHRLSTVAGADEIVVLVEGRIAERGTHQELLAHGGTYARLWQLQSEQQGRTTQPVLSASSPDGLSP